MKSRRSYVKRFYVQICYSTDFCVPLWCHVSLTYLTSELSCLHNMWINNDHAKKFYFSLATTVALFAYGKCRFENLPNNKGQRNTVNYTYNIRNSVFVFTLVETDLGQFAVSVEPTKRSAHQYFVLNVSTAHSPKRSVTDQTV